MTVDMFNHWGDAWADFMLTALVDGTVLLALVALLWLFLRRRASAQLGYLLFLLVIARLAMPLAVPAPAPLAWLSPHDASTRLWQWMNAKPELPRVRPDADRTENFATAADLEANRDLLPRAVDPISAPAIAPRLSYRAWLMFFWAATAVLLLARFGCVQRNTARRFRGLQPIAPADSCIDVAALGRRLGLRRPVPLSSTEAVGSPVVWGLWRPKLILPPGLLERLPPGQLEWALLHELAHVRRGDLWVALVQRLVQIAYFFHPAVWLANRQIDRQREFACDDAALAAASSSGRDCASALVSIAEWACGVTPCSALGLFDSTSKTFLRRRVMRLAHATSKAPRRLSVLSTVFLAVAAALLLPHLRAQGAPKDDKKKSSAIATQNKAENTRRVTDAERSDNAADNPDSTSIELPPLEERAAAAKTIYAAGGRVYPDLDKLRAQGVTRDFFNPKYPFVSASFQRAKLTDKALDALAAFPELERLSLAESGVTDEQLAKLPLRNLKWLNLNDTPVTDEGLAHLRPLAKLEYLELARTAVTGSGFKTLAATEKLVSIDLDETPITDAGVAYLAQIPNLAILSLNKTAVGDVALEHLQNSRNLRSLNLQATRVTDAGLAPLSSLHKLSAFNLRFTRVSDAGIQAVAHLPRMYELSLGGTRVTDASTAIIARWSDLRSLDLGETAVTEIGIKRLHGLTNLDALWLRGTKVSDTALQTFAEMDKLQMLDLSSTPITDAGLAFLKPLTSLERLNLSHTSISDPRLEPLQALAKLASVDVSGTSVTALDLFRALPQTNPNVQKLLAAMGEKTELDFSGQPLSDVIDYLKQRHDIEIQFYYRSLAQARVEVNVPITASVTVTLREALNKILEPLKLLFAVRHEVLLIATKPFLETAADFPLVPAGERISPKLAEAFMQKTELDFAEQPFRDVIVFLAKKHGIVIEIDAESLLAAGIGLDVPVSRWVKGITLKSALELILAELDLTCVAEGDKVIIRARSDD